MRDRANRNHESAVRRNLPFQARIARAFGVVIARKLVPGGVFDNQGPEFVAEYCRRTPLGRMAQPEDYQGAIVFLASGVSDFLTGSTLIVDGGQIIVGPRPQRS